MEMEIHQAAAAAAAGGDDKNCRRHNGKSWRCKKPSGDNKLQYCEKHYKIFTDFFLQNPSLLTSTWSRFLTKEKRKEVEMEKMKLLPNDDQFCTLNNGVGWRCKNFRMGHGGDGDDSVPKTSYCQKHYNMLVRKNKFMKTSGEIGTEGAGPIEEIRVSKRMKKDDDWSIDVRGIQLGSGVDASHAIVEVGMVDLESLQYYKSKCLELSVELEKRKVECKLEEVEETRNTAAATDGTEQTPADALQGKLEEVEKTRNTAAAAAVTDETELTPPNATESWSKMFSGLESRVTECVESSFSDLKSLILGMENRISKLESLVLMSGQRSSILRCVELRDPVKIECEEPGLQNDVLQSGEKQRDENSRNRPSAETSSGGRKDSNVGSLYLSCGGENVEEGKDWGCSEERVERPSQHGQSKDHLEMSTTPFVNLVSDDDSVEILGEAEDSDSSTGSSEGSLGALMDMLAMKYRNPNKDKEIKWESDADMLSSLEEDHELCMKAVCALHRQQISQAEDKGMLRNSDAIRCTTLAKFLLDEDYGGDLNKSVKELEIFDSKAVDDCKGLARRYSTQLFSIYQNGKDPFFLPGTTASHGDVIDK